MTALTRCLALTLIVAGLLTGNDGYAAPIIFDNGPPDPDPVLRTALFSDFDIANPFGFQQIADDFTLASGLNTITDIHWWGVYGNTGTRTAADDFTVRFFNDAGGLPETSPIVEFAIGDTGATATGEFLTGPGFAFEIFEFSTSISPVTLAPGTTFWLSIVNNTVADTDDNWGWVTSSFFGPHAFRFADGAAWQQGTENLAFNLTGAAVPEPTTLVLLVTGLAGLGAFRWRRQRRQ